MLPFPRAENSLIRSSLIRSWATVSDLLRMLKTVSESLRSLRRNEQPWAKRSGRSRQMSDHEQFTQVAQRKWANERFTQKILVKKSKIFFYYVLLRFFQKKFEKMSESLIFAQLISSFLVSDVSESLIWLKSNEWCERIAHFDHQKWATMSDSLRLLRGN